MFPLDVDRNKKIRSFSTDEVMRISRMLAMIITLQSAGKSTMLRGGISLVN